MAQIQPKGKKQNKRFQFNAPLELLEEFEEKKAALDALGLSVDMTEDFVKVIKDTLKQMDKRLSESDDNKGGTSTAGSNLQAQA
ncbi:hypothetical protein [Enterobacter hormaechei]|uniref:hypothetical protein n=1 Tax=Enterobacter hormaechei TaxID=158836 RepID=UPI0026F044F1|nr:hypothetical protein [Enterobacter hormaechei]